MSCGNLRRFDEEKIELWVVDEGVLLRILKDIDNPILEEQLRRKMIVVPMSLYNSIVCNARVDDGEQIKFIKQSAKITNVLTDIMIRATSCEDEYENVAFFRCNYLSDNEGCKLGIRFAFIVNVGMGGVCSTVKFCERNIKSIIIWIRMEFAFI